MVIKHQKELINYNSTSIREILEKDKIIENFLEMELNDNQYIENSLSLYN